MKNFKNKVAFVTGASSGIGEALARELASRGSHLALLARRTDRLEKLAQELRSAYGVQILALSCDVNREGELETAAIRVRNELGGIDLVFPNAGYCVLGSVESLALEDFQKQFDTNVWGVMRTIRATLPDLKKSRGVLALTGSLCGYISTPDTAPYAMSKFATRALAESLFYELAGYGIKVKYFAPGFVESEIRQVNNSGELIQGFADPVPSFIRMTAAAAAKKFVGGLAGNKREIVITRHAQFAVFMQRHFPGLVSFIISKAKITAQKVPDAPISAPARPERIEHGEQEAKL